MQLIRTHSNGADSNGAIHRLEQVTRLAPLDAAEVHSIGKTAADNGVIGVIGAIHPLADNWCQIIGDVQPLIHVGWVAPLDAAEVRPGGSF